MSRSAVMVFGIAFCALLFPEANAGAVGPGKALTWPGGGRGVVEFEGEEHSEEGYGCADCHPALFSMRRRAAAMTMEALDAGGFCGACHNGKRAFSTSDPKECHECHHGARKRKKRDTRKRKKAHHNDDE